MRVRYCPDGGGSEVGLKTCRIGRSIRLGAPSPPVSEMREALMNEVPTTNDDEGRLVWTVEEAGRLLGISRAHAYELVARGELPHLRLGRRVVVPKYAIEELLARAVSDS
jgi:excisionase family DNA binding protein